MSATFILGSLAHCDEPIVDEDALRDFYAKYVASTSADDDLAVYMEHSTISRKNGKNIIWNANDRLRLTYCVSNSFGGNKTAVVNAMNSAAKAWENAVNGGLNFIHVTSQDGNCTTSNNNVIFDVRPVRGQRYLARAFFPDSIWSRHALPAVQRHRRLVLNFNQP